MSGSLAVAGKQVMILLVGTFGGAYLAGGFRIANQLGVALIALAQQEGALDPALRLVVCGGNNRGARLTLGTPALVRA